MHRVRFDDYISIALHGCFWFRVINICYLLYVFLFTSTAHASICS